MRKSLVPPANLSKGLCRNPSGPDFFSQIPQDVRQAKNLCALCPVRMDCLRWALGNQEVYGVWGGADQWEMRTALALTSHGAPVKKAQRAKCPFCRSSRTVTEVLELANRASRAHCAQCGLSWRRAKSFVKRERAKRGSGLQTRLSDAA